MFLCGRGGLLTALYLLSLSLLFDGFWHGQSAADYAADGIYMTSVDTGWINDEVWHTPVVAFESMVRGAYRIVASGAATL